jgi:palmitoyl-protein thioesterase
LDKLVLVLFEQDKTVVPKESAWFGSFAVPDGDDGDDLDYDRQFSADQMPLKSRTTADDDDIIPMREHPLYTEDWIGLRKLDERGGVVFESCDSEHMRISVCWEDLIRNYTGSLE